MTRHAGRSCLVPRAVWLLLASGCAAYALAAAGNTPTGVRPGYPPVTLHTAVQGTGILILFIILAVSIAARKIPAMIALPVMALGIGLIAGIPLTGSEGILSTILEGRTPPKAAAPSGSFQLYKAIIYTLFGGMFARFIADAGIAERVIKYTAEFGGEDPFFIALLMSVVTALIFTATGGLPVIIMLGTVMFPVLLSLGVPPVVCGSMLLLAFPVGAALSPANWASSAEIFGVSLAKARSFFLIWAGVQAVVLLLFLSIEFLRMKRTTVRVRSVLFSIGWIVVVAAVLLGIAFAENLASYLGPGTAGAAAVFVKARGGAWRLIQIAVAAVIIAGVLHAQYAYLRHRRTTCWNVLTPVLPLVFILVLGFGDAIIPAFMASLAYGFFTSPRARGMQKLGRSMIDGIADIAAPVVLMIGIGMLVAAAMHPQVERVLTPLLAHVIPSTPGKYVVFFLLVSPLALYRGPLNTYGLGAGLARLMSNFMPQAATMGALMSVGMLQDPTTTQNIWICGYLKLNINALLFKLFFYSIGLCVAGLVISAWMFF